MAPIWGTDVPRNGAKALITVRSTVGHEVKLVIQDVDDRVIDADVRTRPQPQVWSPPWRDTGQWRPGGNVLLHPEQIGLLARTRPLGAVWVSDVTIDREPVNRMPSSWNTPAGEVALMLVRRGSIALECNGTHQVVREGDLMMFDGGRPYRLVAVGRLNLAAVQAEARALGLLPDGVRRLAGTAWPTAGGMRALSATTLACLADNLEEIEETAAEAMGSSVTSFLRGLFIERLLTQASDPSVTRQVLLLKILDHARDTLGEVTLAPARVAQHFGISLRHLQGLFADLGTGPARWIRDERLARLRDDLRNPRFDHLTVAALGEAWGMVGASHVSRLFRTKYGISPSECRRLRTVPEGPGR